MQRLAAAAGLSCAPIACARASRLQPTSLSPSFSRVRVAVGVRRHDAGQRPGPAYVIPILVTLGKVPRLTTGRVSRIRPKSGRRTQKSQGGFLAPSRRTPKRRGVVLDSELAKLGKIEVFKEGTAASELAALLSTHGYMAQRVQSGGAASDHAAT